MTLRGVTVLITRQREQSTDLVRAVEERGGRPVVVPMIRIVPPDTWEECDRAIDRLEEYDGIIFTSPNAVLWFFRRRDERMTGRTAMGRVAVYAVGPSTRAALEREGVEAAAIPDQSSAEALADMLRSRAIGGKRFLFPRGDLAGPEVLCGLEDSGAAVDSPVVYRTVSPDPRDIRTLLEMTRGRAYGVAVFASPSAVRNFATAVSAATLRRLAPRVKTVAAGQTTSGAMRQLGFPVHGVALEAGSAGMIRAIEHVVQGS